MESRPGATQGACRRHDFRLRIGCLVLRGPLVQPNRNADDLKWFFARTPQVLLDRRLPYISALTWVVGRMAIILSWGGETWPRARPIRRLVGRGQGEQHQQTEQGALQKNKGKNAVDAEGPKHKQKERSQRQTKWSGCPIRRLSSPRSCSTFAPAALDVHGHARPHGRRW